MALAGPCLPPACRLLLAGAAPEMQAMSNRSIASERHSPDFCKFKLNKVSSLSFNGEALLIRVNVLSAMGPDLEVVGPRDGFGVQISHG